MWVDRQASFLPELGIKPVVDQISKQKGIILKFSCGKRLSGEGYRSHGEKVACSEFKLKAGDLIGHR